MLVSRTQLDKPLRGPEAPSSMAQLPSSQLPDKPKRKRLRRPEKGSLFHTLRENAGLSLFVRPLRWTDLHTKLLKAQFNELPPCSTPVPSTLPELPPSKGHMQPSQTIMTLSDALTAILSPSAMHALLSLSAVKTVLATLWPNAFGQTRFAPEFHLYFGGRVYSNAIRTQVAWGYPSKDLSPFQSVSIRPADSFNIPSTASSGPYSAIDSPMLCYMSKNLLASMRKNLFRVAQGPKRSRDEPVWRLQQLRSKLLAPANPDQDAYFVGIFLAMAQRHFYATPPPSGRKDCQWSSGDSHPPQPQFRDLKLRILSHDIDTAEFLVYTGYVTAKFLERFHRTHQTPKLDVEEGIPGLKIEYTRVPIWPILGLRERLGKAFGEDVVGPFDPEYMTTWEEDDEDVKEKLSSADTWMTRMKTKMIMSGSKLKGSASERLWVKILTEASTRLQRTRQSSEKNEDGSAERTPLGRYGPALNSHATPLPPRVPPAAILARPFNHNQRLYEDPKGRVPVTVNLVDKEALW